MHVSVAVLVVDVVVVAVVVVAVVVAELVVVMVVDVVVTHESHKTGHVFNQFIRRNKRERGLAGQLDPL
jgi:hypothetical protein